MDILHRLLSHDEWTTRAVLQLCRDLNDDQLDGDFDIGHRTLRATLIHLIGNLQVWTALMTQRPVPPRESSLAWASSSSTLLDAWEKAMADFVQFSMQIAAEGRLDDSYLDTLDDPPKSKTYGGTIAHLLTHDMLHRGDVLHILQRLGISNLPEGDVLTWEATVGETTSP